MSMNYQKPRQQYGKTVMGWDPAAKKMRVWDDPAPEVRILYDSRKGVIQGERAYGYYQAMYVFHPDIGEWTFKQGSLWGDHWRDITENAVPASVRLAVTLLSC